MSNKAIPPAPVPTQKTERKAAAAAAKDPKIFQQTEFGRQRIRAAPIRLLLRIIALLSTPVVLVRRWMGGSKAPE